ncbi:putative transferase transcription regulator GNAT family [Helianthus annuus]|nr:putative transferase transcription regulator GNAT family [Helianthus annuus]KAJ0619468.1 putative transferase transcription regulator GNAT family [Helianthus annuus]KAJ0630108.1 putative transferase transcription regulator GNAT family [Helianthus annuus]KAJ0630239.1 putative transferase transcription regulator GNAT family [Helianthus annuus]KAJ0940774.1 putative transferase transcription regulator GNAT family [Helianthus annuus]
MVANGAVSVSLDSVRDKNLMQLKKLNSVLFPVRYNDKYYADALASHHFTKLGINIIIIQQIRHLYGSLFEFFYVSVCIYCWVLSYYSDICVGSIACRLEKKEDGAIRVYIMTLGVLAPYRGLGIGTKLLNHVIDLSSKENIGEIYLHVQTNNEDAINFYKKFGFEITETIKNYYARITPPDCYVVTKYIRQPQSEK